MEFRLVVPSQNRSDIINDKTLRYFPNAEVIVPESQKESYEKTCRNVIAHPDSVIGIGPKRKWIMENVIHDCVVMMDDDLNKVYSLTGLRSRSLNDKTMIRHVISRAAFCSKEAGAYLFSFNHGDIRKFVPQKPFSLCSWGGGIFGYHKGHGLSFDPNLRSRGEDIDLFIQSLKKHRFVWIDSRFVFMFQQWKTPGGNSANRNSIRQQEEIGYLKRKWGKYIKVIGTKTCQRILLKIER